MQITTAPLPEDFCFSGLALCCPKVGPTVVPHVHHTQAHKGTQLFSPKAGLISIRHTVKLVPTNTRTPTLELKFGQRRSLIGQKKCVIPG